jgi:hypothetical protein
MVYRNALKLHKGDEVTIKKTGYVMMVVTTETQLGRKNVNIMCEDGNWYHHTEVK